MKRSNRFFEVGALLIVILIPIGFVLYANFGSSPAAAPSVPAQQNVPVTVTPQNVPATISLDDPSSLPQTVTAAELVPFSFTIQNTGAVSGQIPFKVSVKWSTGEQDVIDENIVALAGGASTTVQEQLKFEVATETAEVYLELPQNGQTEQFALPRAQ